MVSEVADPALLQKFSPLDGLKRETLAALARKTSLKVLPAGRLLFREGISDECTLYLVRGEVERPSSGRVRTLPAIRWRPVARGASLHAPPPRSSTCQSTATCSTSC